MNEVLSRVPLDLATAKNSIYSQYLCWNKEMEKDLKITRHLIKKEFNLVRVVTALRKAEVLFKVLLSKT